MQRELGMLAAKVDMLLEAVRRSEEKSDINRASMHRRMDEIVDRVSKVETTTVTVKEDIEEIKPTVDDVKMWRQRGLGGLAVIGLGSSALTFFLTSYGGSIISWLSSKH